MEVERNDARIARDRMLGALEGCTDREKGQSLWRAMARYNGRMRDEADSALVIAGPPLAVATR